VAGCRLNAIRGRPRGKRRSEHQVQERVHSPGTPRGRRAARGEELATWRRGARPEGHDHLSRGGGARLKREAIITQLVTARLSL